MAMPNNTLDAHGMCRLQHSRSVTLSLTHTRHAGTGLSSLLFRLLSAIPPNLLLRVPHDRLVQQSVAEREVL